MTAREKVDRTVVELWLAIKELGETNPDQLNDADLQLIKAVSHHTTVQKIINDAFKMSR